MVGSWMANDWTRMANDWTRIAKGPNATIHHLPANLLLVRHRQGREQVPHRRTNNKLQWPKARKQEAVSWDYLQ
jgi:hypothetical protein